MQQVERICNGTQEVSGTHKVQRQNENLNPGVLTPEPKLFQHASDLLVGRVETVFGAPLLEVLILLVRGGTRGFAFFSIPK